jgi:plastocyanin
MKKVVVVALLALSTYAALAFVPAQRDGLSGLPVENRPDGQQGDTIFIQIVADADSVVAVPNVVTASPGQVVTWTTELGDWTVFFQSAQPFGQQAVGQGIRGGRGQRNGQAVRNEAAPGRYKYDILVQVQGGRNLRADPEVVITPGEHR